MRLEPDVCYRALVAQDRRFDGVFYTGVLTTGIYCRPVCPARTPRKDRCRFFPSAAAAEQASFRPCLRCRPELAPGDAPMDASGRIARLAAARIAAGALGSGGNVESLAEELGIGPRQLRRVVQQELGVSPVRLAQSCRLLLAKQLLTESRLPIVQVAFASGFASLRRFNAAFREHYGFAPRDLRKQRTKHADDGGLRLTLAYRPPFDWRQLLSFLSARAIPGVEFVDAQRYLRTVAIGEQRGWVGVAPDSRRNVVHVEIADSLVAVLPQLLGRLRRLFDLDAQPEVIREHLRRDPHIGPAVRRRPGLRVPGAMCGFELALRGVLGQQISVGAATTLSGRIADALGEPLETPFAELQLTSPTAERIAGATVDELASLGLVGKRAECLIELARAACEERINLEPGPQPDQTVAELARLPGIGPWTAHYIAMRALRWPDAFPHSDLALRKALGSATPKQILELAEPWRPWRSYAAIHLWADLNSTNLKKGA